MAKNNGSGSVLIMRFSALGDVAMTIPCVYDVCRNHPDRQFVFLTRTFPARLFVNAPENLVVRGIDTADYKGVRGLLRLFRGLRQEFNIDCVVDLHDVLRTQILRKFALMSGITVRHIDKGRTEKRALTRKNRKVLKQLEPTIERYRDTLRRAGLDITSSFHSIFETKAADASLFAKASSDKKSVERWYGIAPFAKHPGKILPVETMRKVVDALKTVDNVKIFLFGGGEKENAILQQWSGENVVNMAELKIGLEGELALMSRLDAIVTMDSANMHFASLVGTRAVTVWGATHPFAGFMGHGQCIKDAVQLPLPCRPCSIFGNKPCHLGDYPCLAGITPDAILRLLTP
ncbi:MAG: glycosyltransferase family 9 protein [Muribaculaceae bacterium]|nr:glycosyltransferase family 9 protein [Muribaculaceae bacterium]